MAIVRRIGVPENDSERHAVSFLAEHLPGDDFVLFHNLELANRAGFPYEYDMILVGEYAVYAIEVKHYGGTIQGNEIEWQLASGHVIPSPMPLANKKARILRDRLVRRSPLLNQVFVVAIIVLTKEPVRLRIRDEQQDRMLPLSEAPGYILDPHRLPVSANRVTHLTDRICEAIMSQFTPLCRRRAVGDYDITETLDGADGYRVNLGRHRLLKAHPPVLLKVYTLDIYANKAQQERQREILTRDAEALYRLGEHPNIARVVGFFPWEAEKLVLAVEWLDLRSLRSVFQQSSPLPERDVLTVGSKILTGLTHAHERQVIHRNLRPESVLVGDHGEVKLANFDLARVNDEAFATIATRLKGRIDPTYAAPEVRLSPAAATPQSDLYSVGQILREGLTGRTDGSVSGDAGEIIERLTAQDPAERYQSAAAAADDIAVLI